MEKGKLFKFLPDLIARILSFIVLTLTFYLIITPLGIFRRLIQGDFFGTGMGALQSYWVEKKEESSIGRYHRQF
ncbi:MAG: hypothetical protein ABSB18_00955 [Candidatus Omnitrophota bacterium]